LFFDIIYFPPGYIAGNEPLMAFLIF